MANTAVKRKRQSFGTGLALESDSVLKVLGGAGILPVGRTGWKPVLLNLSFCFFGEEFTYTILILLSNWVIFSVWLRPKGRDVPPRAAGGDARPTDLFRHYGWGTGPCGTAPAMELSGKPGYNNQNSVPVKIS
jgi:hypothetical protein